VFARADRDAALSQLSGLLAVNIKVGTVEFMRKKITTLMTITLTGSLLLGACSRGGEEVIEVPDESTTTVDTRVTPPTLAPGSQIALGEFESVEQELDVACEAALKPIRDLEAKYQSGLDMTDDDRPAFNDALSKGLKDCSDEEWSRFQELELKGWMNAVPAGAVNTAGPATEEPGAGSGEDIDADDVDADDDE
jgi:hypothetical protein